MQELREATGLTQQKLADFVMERRATISMFESGLRPMPIAAMQQLTDLFLLLPPNDNAENIPLVINELAVQTAAADKAVENYQRQCSLKLQYNSVDLRELLL